MTYATNNNKVYLQLYDESVNKTIHELNSDPNIYLGSAIRRYYLAGKVHYWVYNHTCSRHLCGKKEL